MSHFILVAGRIFTLEKLVEGGYVYVDKTARLYDLVRPPYGVYFLSRPRRFGKSLTISTLEAVFQGRRELFRGLAIDAADYDWKPYPVIRIDLGDKPARTPEELETALVYAIEQNAERHAIRLKQTACNLMFNELVTALGRHEKVVIFFVLLRLLALDVDCEVRTEAGRIDAVIKTAARIFVFEFKLQGTAEEALQQIHQRRYHEKYTADDRELLLIGAAFDPEIRNLERGLVERM